VIDKLIAATWKAQAAAGLAAQVQRATDAVLLYDLMALAANESAPAQVRAIAGQKLEQLQGWCNQLVPDPSLAAFYAYSAAQIKRFQTNSKDIGVPRPPAPPPGMPIGDDERDYAVR